MQSAHWPIANFLLFTYPCDPMCIQWQFGMNQNIQLKHVKFENIKNIWKLRNISWQAYTYNAWITCKYVNMKLEFLYRKYTFIVWNFHTIKISNMKIWKFQIWKIKFQIQIWKFHTINVYFLYKNSGFIFTYLVCDMSNMEVDICLDNGSLVIYTYDHNLKCHKLHLLFLY